MLQFPFAFIKTVIDEDMQNKTIKYRNKELEQEEIENMYVETIAEASNFMIKQFLWSDV